MANEAVLIYELEPAIPMTCADGTGIEKGACLKIADPYTVSQALSANDYVGGIAKTEKIASDGKTKISVFRRGIFRVLASGSITCGQTITNSGVANAFIATTASSVASKSWGIALETASAGETFLMELNPASNSTAYS